VTGPSGTHTIFLQLILAHRIILAIFRISGQFPDGSNADCGKWIPIETGGTEFIQLSAVVGLRAE